MIDLVERVARAIGKRSETLFTSNPEEQDRELAKVAIPVTRNDALRDND